MSLDELERLAMPESVELDQHLPPSRRLPSNRHDRRTGSTLGTKGRRFTPPRIWSFLNSANEPRFHWPRQRHGTRCYWNRRKRTSDRTTLQERRGTVWRSSPAVGVLLSASPPSQKPDELPMPLGSKGKIPAEPEQSIDQRARSSDANLSRVICPTVTRRFRWFWQCPHLADS